jgi:hypothetical protein
MVSKFDTTTGLTSFGLPGFLSGLRVAGEQDERMANQATKGEMDTKVYQGGENGESLIGEAWKTVEKKKRSRIGARQDSVLKVSFDRTNQMKMEVVEIVEGKKDTFPVFRKLKENSRTNETKPGKKRRKKEKIGFVISFRAFSRLNFFLPRGRPNHSRLRS